MMIRVFRILIVSFCLLLTACVTPQAQADKEQPFSPLPMPEVFLGEWLRHGEEHFHTTIYPDSTIKTIYEEDNQLVAEHQYKVIHIYGPERVAAFYKRRGYAGKNKGDWSKPWLTFFYMRHIGPTPYNSAESRLHWGNICFIVSKEEWENPMLYKEQMLSRVSPKQDCSGTGYPTHMFIRK